MAAALLLLTCHWLAVGANPSIMDLIDIQGAEQLLAQRRPNGTWAAATGRKAVTDEPEDDELDVQGNSVSRHGRKHGPAAIPDISTVLSELSRPPQITSTQPAMLVAKKGLIRKDWCRTEPLVQKVRAEGCVPKNVVNRFCYGQCNSFFIPKNLSVRRGGGGTPGGGGRRKRPDEVDDAPSFRSCAVCKPSKFVWVQVTLHCPGLVPPLRRRRVQKVKHCQCMAQ